MPTARTPDAAAAADPQTRRRAAAAEALAAAESRAGRGTENRARGTGEIGSGAIGFGEIGFGEIGVEEIGPGESPVRGPAGPAAARPGRRGRRERAPAPPPDAALEGSEPLPEEVARAIVLKQLSMAPRSRQQLADKLRQRGCLDDVAARVLDRMEAVGLVDDEAYAQMMVRSKQATRGLAKRALAQELRGKGIADHTIDDALGSIDTESERALAESVARKAMRRLAGLDSQVQARRLAGVLGRKGYPPSVVYAVVRDTVNDAPEHQRD